MHTYYTSSPTCRIEFIAWKIFKRNLWNVFLFSWHDDLNLKQFIPIDQHCWEGSLLFLLLSVLYILVCNQFLPSNIFCQCIVTSTHKIVYEKWRNKLTMYWREMVPGKNWSHDSTYLVAVRIIASLLFYKIATISWSRWSREK